MRRAVASVLVVLVGAIFLLCFVVGIACGARCSSAGTDAATAFVPAATRTRSGIAAKNSPVLRKIFRRVFPRQPSSFQLLAGRKRRGGGADKNGEKKESINNSTMMNGKRQHEQKRFGGGGGGGTNELTLEFEMVPSILDIPSEEWDACLSSAASPDGGSEPSSPFLEHSWLRCMEESGCASPETGWVPQHVRVVGHSVQDGEQQQQTLGFVPLYVKGHSMGEFIFDTAWSEAAQANGIDYYPKLLVGVPFTPASGRRFLWHPSAYERFGNGGDNSSEDGMRQLNRAAGAFLRRLASSNGLSSVHCNFLTDVEATDLCGPLDDVLIGDRDSTSGPSFVDKLLRRSKDVVKDDYLRRTSLQYHWSNRNPKNGMAPFADFGEYLGCFKSKRRISIKRERSKVLDEQGIRVDAVVGRDILNHEGLVERMYEIYKSTIDKMLWGRQYLSLEFFQSLADSDFVDNLCFMCARRRREKEDGAAKDDDFRAEDVFAGTFNVVKDGVFYGRYWGCLPGEDVKNLHFEVCYWSAIEYCIDNGLSRMEPGAGGGDYKWARGFDPALIHSIHYICHAGLRRAVGQYLAYEAEDNVSLTEYLLERSKVAAAAAQAKAEATASAAGDAA